jgi:hypothetical protein
MPFQYENGDLLFSDDGDFAIDVYGDLADTLEDGLKALSQSIRDRVKYPAGSWSLYPDKGVAFLPFGMYNLEANAELYEDVIKNALTVDGLVFSEDLEVDVADIGDDIWLIAVSVLTQPSPLNNGSSKRIFFLSFDQSSKKIQYY